MIHEFELTNDFLINFKNKAVLKMEWAKHGEAVEARNIFMHDMHII